MFKKSDEEDSYRERVYTKIKKVTQKTTRKNDYKKNSQKKSGADLSSYNNKDCRLTAIKNTTVLSTKESNTPHVDIQPQI